MPHETVSSFDPVSRRVAAWVLLRRWVAVLNASLRPACGVMLAAALVIWLFGGGWSLFLLAAPWLWLAGTLVWSWRRRPGPYSALALWDEAAGRREAFATAWWFGRQGGVLPAAARAHLESQLALLPQALPGLRKDLPLRPARWLWLPFVLALAGGMAAKRHGPGTALDAPLDARMQEAAQREAERLARTEWEKKQLEGLSAAEREELEALKQKLRQTAEGLQSGAGQSSRQVMGELERRARDAEKLAEKLASDKDAWASQELVEALRRQADTADLGDAVAARQAATAAAAADALAARLKDPALPAEARDRFDEALHEAGKHAEPEDRDRTVGRHVLSAGDELRQSQPQAAGAEFETLAERLRELSLREQSRKELEKLAQQLRESGGNIAGQQGEGGAMQSMTAAGQQGQSGQPGATPRAGQAQAGQGSQAAPQALQPPGLGQGAQQQGQAMNAMQPGQGQGRPMQMAQPGQSGQPGQQGAPMLLAPVPGQKPGDKPPDMLILGGPTGGAPDGGMAFAMPGGKDPGVGRAELNADPTTRQDSAGASVVNAQPGAEGPSSSRAVEGGLRQENSARAAVRTAVDFLAAEESALDEAALPAARREQVRRYFNELRRRFEEGGK